MIECKEIVYCILLHNAPAPRQEGRTKCPLDFEFFGPLSEPDFVLDWTFLPLFIRNNIYSIYITENVLLLSVDRNSQEMSVKVPAKDGQRRAFKCCVIRVFTYLCVFD